MTTLYKQSSTKFLMGLICHFGILILISILFTNSINAQVQFKVELLDDDETYQVSIRPDVTWEGSDGLTATAQVTVLAPTGGFVLSDLQSVNGTWSANSDASGPEENPDFDYFAIGLANLGTDDIAYIEGQEEILFLFKNSGTCTGPVELMEANDPFTPPNSLNLNIGNQLATLGAGNVNAWSGNYDIGSADCSAPMTVLGCTDDEACNYDPLATEDDNSCNYGDINCPDACNPIYGCTDPAFATYDPDANCQLNDECGTEIIAGCFDESACNYDPMANYDEGNECEYGILTCPDACTAFLGCTDENAQNFNPAANCEDGSCTYAPDDPFCVTPEFFTSCISAAEELVLCTQFCELGDTYSINTAVSVAGSNVTITNDTCFRFTPLPGFESFGIDTVLVTACNADGECANSNAIITIGDCTIAGITAINDIVATNPGESITISPLSNDGNVANNTNNVNLCMQDNDGMAANGTVTVNNDGTITYMPDAGYMGVDQFSYTICDSDGEMSQAQIIVTVDEISSLPSPIAQGIEKIYIPNVFTPNQDGVNDVLEITNLENISVNAMIEFYIFNQLGQQVFITNREGLKYGWDGIDENGRPAIEGVYFYQIRIINQYTKTFEKAGFIELRR